MENVGNKCVMFVISIILYPCNILNLKSTMIMCICKRFLHGVHLDVIRKLEKCTVRPSLRNFDGKKLYLNQLNLKKVLFYISVHFLARDNYLGKVLRILCASE